jgi:hypothetical protein
LVPGFRAEHDIDGRGVSVTDAAEPVTLRREAARPEAGGVDPTISHTDSGAAGVAAGADAITRRAAGHGRGKLVVTVNGASGDD